MFVNRSARGMTLIEVLFALVILVAGLLIILAILSTGFQAHKRAVNETEAGMVAASVLDSTRAEFFRGNLPLSNAKNVFTESEDFPKYKFNLQIMALEPGRKGTSSGSAGREYFVRIEVQWSDRGDRKSIKVDTVMFRSLKE